MDSHAAPATGNRTSGNTTISPPTRNPAAHILDPFNLPRIPSKQARKQIDTDTPESPASLHDFVHRLQPAVDYANANVAHLTAPVAGDNAMRANDVDVPKVYIEAIRKGRTDALKKLGFSNVEGNNHTRKDASSH